MKQAKISPGNWSLYHLTHLCPAYSIEYTFDQNFNFNLRRDHQKNSYERRAYESVDEKSLC